MKYIRNDRFICRKIIDNIILFPVNCENNFQGGISLNNVSYFVWEMLITAKTEYEISTMVAEKFQENINVVRQDIIELLEQFVELKVVNIEN